MLIIGRILERIVHYYNCDSTQQVTTLHQLYMLTTRTHFVGLCNSATAVTPRLRICSCNSRMINTHARNSRNGRHLTDESGGSGEAKSINPLITIK